MSSRATREQAEEIEALLAALTLTEKVSLCAGSGMWHSAAVPRLGIGRLKVTDGPNGARGEALAGLTAACFPVGSALAASWDPVLLAQIGAALGQEALSKGAQVLLGPTVNLHRSPLGGRHFECYSEDPHLSARMALAFVRGVQSQGVGACIKHFLCNESEFERMTISSEVSMRAMRELYLVPFEAAVKEGGVWSIMSSYNRIGGSYAGSHRQLVEVVLRGEWGFDGCVITDWYARFDGGAHGLAVADLEMPGPARAFGGRLRSAVEDGELAEAVLDDKVRRLLRLMQRTGRLQARGEAAETVDDRPEHRALARKAAIDGMVLIKNEGVLPLQLSAGQTLAVIGPNAEHGMIQGGGSSGVKPHYVRHPLAALRARLSPKLKVVHASGGRIGRYVAPIDKSRLRAAGERGRAGLALEYWNGREFAGPCVERRVVGRCGGSWHGRFSERVDPQDFCARYAASYTPEVSGEHTFGLSSSGGARLFVDDALVIDAWAIDESVEPFYGQLLPEARGTRELRADEAVQLRVEFRTRLGRRGGDGAPLEQGGTPSVHFGVQPPIAGDPIEAAAELAATADAVVLVVGSSAEYESEGRDREDLELPGHQVALIEAVVAANPQTAVVLNCGAPVTLDWLPQVPALLQAFFPGQEFGEALADVLLGETDPGGRMPTTWPVRLEDAPGMNAGERSYPGKDGQVEYSEDVLLGYRWYDHHGIAPRVCFGHGLSYTQFEYGALRLSANPERVDSHGDVSMGSVICEVSLEVRNVGERAGREVVQLYVSSPGQLALRPERELRAFEKVNLRPGEARELRFTLDRRAFSYWNEETSSWAVEPGRHQICVGASSRDIRRCVALELDA